MILRKICFFRNHEAKEIKKLRIYVPELQIKMYLNKGKVNRILYSMS